MAGLGAVLMLYLVLISLGLASWGKLVEGFDPNDPVHITRIACEVGERLPYTRPVFTVSVRRLRRNSLCSTCSSLLQPHTRTDHDGSL